MVTHDSLEALSHEIDRGGARPPVIDSLLGTLPDERDQALTAALLLLLSDEVPHDEGMFSIIHPAEAADAPTYVGALLTGFARLAAKAPRWGSIVLMRVLNDESSRLELIRQLRAAPDAIREPIQVMCERINAVGSDFLARTIPVILACRPAATGPR